MRVAVFALVVSILACTEEPPPYAPRGVGDEGSAGEEPGDDRTDSRRPSSGGSAGEDGGSGGSGGQRAVVAGSGGTSGSGGSSGSGSTGAGGSSGAGGSGTGGSSGAGGSGTGGSSGAGGSGTGGSSGSGGAGADCVIPESDGPAPTYTIEHIPLDEGYGEVSLNDLGDVIAGRWLWRDGQVVDLGDLGGDFTIVEAINNSRQVVGRSREPDGDMQAVFWQDDTLTPLLRLGGEQAYAVDINEAGEVVGYSERDVGDIVATFWNSQGAPTDLGTWGDDSASRAHALNDSDQIAGTSQVSSSTVGGGGEVLLWDEGAKSAIFTDVDPSHVVIGGLSDSGVLVGSVASAAFRAKRGCEPEPLGNAFGGSYSAAHGINGARQIVGTANDAELSSHAFLFAGGEMHDLEELVVDLGEWRELPTAQDINDCGQIVGVGDRWPAGSTRDVFLLTPVGGCDPPGGDMDGGTDAGTDAGMDAGMDADVDAGPDASSEPDAGMPDAGPADPACGDGHRDDGERCDDGNLEDSDFCNATCSGFDFLCTLDVAPGPSQGVTSIPASAAFVPLCGGHVIATSADRLGVSVYDVVHDDVVWSYALGAAPSALALDRNRGDLYVALEGSKQIARIDLATETDERIQFPNWSYQSRPIEQLVIRADGIVIAAERYGAAVLDGPTGTVHSYNLPVYGELAYDHVHDRLYGALLTTGTMHARRWSVIGNPPTITLEDEHDVGEAGYDVAVSPDGDSVLFVAGDGNDWDRWRNSTFDWPTGTFDEVRGDFTRRSWVPVAAAFSADSRHVALSDYGYPLIFDADHHGVLASYGHEGCLGDHDIAWSPGGKFVYQLGFCEVGARENLQWNVFTAPADEPLPAGSCGNGVLEAGEVCDDGNLLGSDVCAADCLELFPFCTTDRTSTALPLGSDSLGKLSAIEPLCDGWILAGSAEDSVVILRDVVRGREMRRYRLQNRPVDLALDPATGKLWVTTGPAPRIEQVDLQTGESIVMPVPGPARLIQPTGTGSVLAVVDLGLFTDDRQLVSISATTSDVLDSLPARIHTLSYSAGLEQAYAVWGTTLERIAFDPATGLLTSQQTSLGSSYAALAPTDDHLVTSCIYYGGSYGMSDKNPLNITSIRGVYGAACFEQPTFSADGTRLFGMSNTQLYTFDADTRANMVTLGIPTPNCMYWPAITQMAVSRGGSFVYVVRDCGTGVTAEPLVWLQGP